MSLVAISAALFESYQPTSFDNKLSKNLSKVVIGNVILNIKNPSHGVEADSKTWILRFEDD